MRSEDELKAKRADLRDKLDKARKRGKPGRAHNLRTRIQRITSKLRKLRRRRQAQPSVVLTRISPNRSARSTVGISLIVLHSTESANIESSDADLAGVAGWFANPASQVSSHVITDSDGHSARCVEDRDKAWTAAAYNSASLNIEQIGRASQTIWAAEELKETARWIARWSKDHGIPIERAKVSAGRVLSPGVAMHSDLGSAGGGHTDPGSAYPLGQVLDLATNYRKRI
jgi:Negative regulator of beta-lactamase expression